MMMNVGRKVKGEAQQTTTRLKMEADEVIYHDCSCILRFEDEAEFEGGGDVGGTLWALTMSSLY